MAQAKELIVKVSIVNAAGKVEKTNEILGTKYAGIVGDIQTILTAGITTSGILSAFKTDAGKSLIDSKKNGKDLIELVYVNSENKQVSMMSVTRETIASWQAVAEEIAAVQAKNLAVVSAREKLIDAANEVLPSAGRGSGSATGLALL